MRISLFIFWGLLIAAVSAWLGLRMTAGNPIDSNLMTLMPETEESATVVAAVERVVTYAERQHIFLAYGKTPEIARATAVQMHEAMLASGLFELITFKIDDDFTRAAGEFYFPYRHALLSQTSRDILKADGSDAIFRHVQSELLNPFGTVSSALLKEDPFLLFPSFLRESLGVSSNLVLEDEVLQSTQGDRTYVLLAARLAESPYAFQFQDRFAALITTLEQETASTDKDSGFLSAGAINYAIAGTNSAKAEVSTVGLGSLLGVFLLLVVTFRSTYPCTLSIISIATGCLFGFAGCILLFGSIHMLTLVCGASLVGIAIDYSFHFFVEWFDDSERWNSFQALNHILPGITLGLITSLIGLSAFFVTPFVGLQQIAVFTGLGLTAAYFSVLLWYPILTRRKVLTHRPVLLGFIERTLTPILRARSSPLWLLPVLLVVTVAGYGVSQLRAEDDVRSFQTVSEDVAEQDRRVRDIIGSEPATQFFLVTAPTVQRAFEVEEDLKAALNTARRDGELGGYIALSNFVPSQKLQRQNYELLIDHLSEDRGSLARISDAFGFDPAVTLEFKEETRRKADQILPFSDWWQSDLSRDYRHLLLNENSESVSSIIALQGIDRLDLFSALADQVDNVVFVDHVGNISRILGGYRAQASILIAISYFIILLFLIWRYDLRRAVMIMAAPLLALLITLGVFGFIDRPINLFTVIAFLMVLGIGIDYSLFFQEAKTRWNTTALAIFLSAITTNLAFGLLSLSSTEVIQSFGLTIFVGITTTFILSPIVLIGLNREPEGAEVYE